MPNIYETLIGAPPSGPEETAATANQLRGQEQLGMLGILTGDRVLTKFGQTMVNQVQTRVKGLQKSRQKSVEDQIQADRWDTTDTTQEGIRDQAQKNWEERMQFDRDKMKQGNALKRALQEMKNQQTGKEDRRYRQALSRDLTKAGIPEMNEGISIVDAALLPYEGKNLPGFGAGKYSPSDEARALRGKLAGIENVLLKARSGAAVTDQEYARFRKELLGEGMLATDADFRRSWADLKAKIAAAEDGIVRGYDERIVDMYYGRSVAPSGSSAPEIVMGDAMSYLGGT